MFGAAWPDWPAAEVEALAEPIDFLGINYYTRSVVRHDANGLAGAARARCARAARSTPRPAGRCTRTSLTETLLWVHERYGDLPLYVTENGAAFYDPPSAIDGRIDDPLRVHYLQTHIAAVGDAIARGVDVRGYCAWSLLDNLEWAHGFSKRFGLVHVDFETQQRTPKASARWYAQMIASHLRTPRRAA